MFYLLDILNLILKHFINFNKIKTGVAFCEMLFKRAILERFSANGTLIQSYSVIKITIITAKTVLWSFLKTLL